MRIDWYTKGVLTVIAVLLAVIAFKQYVSPDAVVQAQGAFAGVQFDDYAFFDSKTGDVWQYNPGGIGHTFLEHWRLTKLGEPLTRLK